MSTQQKIMDIFNFFDCPLSLDYVVKYLQADGCELREPQIIAATFPLLSTNQLVYNKDNYLEKVQTNKNSIC